MNQQQQQKKKNINILNYQGCIYQQFSLIFFKGREDYNDV